MYMSILLDFLHRKLCCLLAKIHFLSSFWSVYFFFFFLSWFMNQNFWIIVVRDNIFALFPVLWGKLLFLSIGFEHSFSLTVRALEASSGNFTMKADRVPERKTHKSTWIPPRLSSWEFFTQVSPYSSFQPLVRIYTSVVIVIPTSFWHSDFCSR